jgi:hypothetical protein
MQHSLSTGRTFNEQLRSHTEFRNPSIITQLAARFNVSPHDSNLAPSTWSPRKLDPEGTCVVDSCGGGGGDVFVFVAIFLIVLPLLSPIFSVLPLSVRLQKSAPSCAEPRLTNWQTLSAARRKSASGIDCRFSSRLL